jgi:NTP pyrophosphatase (non-canonical NTP hydrolase)
MNIIKKEIPVTELLAGLAEEASELAQAALKLRRVFDKTNPTPTKEEEAIEHLWEEIADVKLYVSMLDVNPREISRIMSEKQKRWESRLAR